MRASSRSTDRPWRALTPERIRAARHHFKMSQKEFALEIGRIERRGIAPDYTKVSRWERAERKPSALWGPAILALVLRAEKEMGISGKEGAGEG